jgi:hypothetical protein
VLNKNRRNMSVENLKQVEISSKQPDFSEQKNPSSNELPPIPTLLPHYFFNEVIRLVVGENHWLLGLFSKKN